MAGLLASGASLWTRRGSAGVGYSKPSPSVPLCGRLLPASRLPPAVFSLSLSVSSPPILLRPEVTLSQRTQAFLTLAVATQ